jgi:hypothetical protein
MSLLEQFVCMEGSWAIVPASVANCLKKNIDIEVHSIKEGPSDRITYYLLGTPRKTEPIDRFLSFLEDFLKQTEGVTSLWH